MSGLWLLSRIEFCFSKYSGAKEWCCLVNEIVDDYKNMDFHGSSSRNSTVKSLQRCWCCPGPCQQVFCPTHTKQWKWIMQFLALTCTAEQEHLWCKKVVERAYWQTELSFLDIFWRGIWTHNESCGWLKSRKVSEPRRWFSMQASWHRLDSIGKLHWLLSLLHREHDSSWRHHNRLLNPQAPRTILIPKWGLDPLLFKHKPWWAIAVCHDHDVDSLSSYYLLCHRIVEYLSCIYFLFFALLFYLDLWPFNCFSHLLVESKRVDHLIPCKLLSSLKCIISCNPSI